MNDTFGLTNGSMPLLSLLHLEDVISFLATSFGLPVFTIYVFLILAFCLISGILMYQLGFAIGICFALLWVWLLAMTGLFPMWIAFMLTLLGLSLLFFGWRIWQPIEAEAPDTQPETFTGDRWLDYGNRIKNAYMAKFGNANPEFNKEVDRRILVMQHNRRGLTREMAEQWLKRMSDFTESK